MIELTYDQVLWLESRGGRTVYDVNVDPNGMKFVIMMGFDRQSKRVYLPEETRTILVPDKPKEEFIHTPEII